MTQVALVVLGALVLVLAAALAWQYRDRRRAATALERSEARLDAVMRHSSLIVVLKDLDFRYVAVNPQYLKTFGVAEADVIGKTTADMYDPAEAAALMEQDQEVLESGETVEREVNLTVNENPRSFYCVKFPVRDASGRIMGFGTISTDVTERRRAERELKDSEARLEALIDHSPLVIAVKDLDGRFLMANPKYYATFGLRPEEVIGKTIFDLSPPDVAGEYDRQDREALRKGRPVARETEEIIQGEMSTMLDIKFPILNTDDEILGIGYIGADITDRKRAEAQLRAAKEAAENADAAKSRFLAAASHDLRQPLYVLKLLFSVLADESDPEQRKNILRDMGFALDSMGGILEALLDISRLDAGVVTPEIASFSAEEFLRRVERQMAPEAAAKGLDLRVVPSHLMLESDQALLERIVQNFLSNSVRYTDKGRVLLGARRRGQHLRIEVWDTGPGIAEDHITAIFEPFYQVDNPARDRSKGLGLGLAIAERTAEVLDHPLDVQSWLGKGSLFAVEVPLAPRQESVASRRDDAPAARALKGAMVAVVDDDRNVVAATRRLLKAQGARVWAGVSCKQVTGQLQEAGICPDVVIADYRLPGGASGIEAIKCVGRDCGNGAMPGLIVTGDTSPGILSEIEAAGLAVLHKPVDPDVLVESIARLLPAVRPEPAAALS